jgi:hypothetical protein
LVLFAAEQAISQAYMQKARGWSDEEWAAAQARLADRGLVADGAITPAGTALRAQIEQTTDELADAPWQALGAEKTQRLADLLRPMAKSLADQNEAMQSNPMAIDARSALA